MTPAPPSPLQPFSASGTPPSRSLLALTAPLVLSFWMRAAFSFVDTAYAAILGDAAIAAIGLAIPLEFLMIACWVGLSNGLTSNLSQAMGAGHSQRIQQLLQSSWVMITRFLMPAFMILAAIIWFWGTHLGLDAEVGRLFAIYGAVTLAGSALTSFWSILPDSLVKAHHDTRATMWAGIWSNVINVLLNTLFLFVFHWGIFGIAFSTVIGRFGGLIYALRKARQHEAVRLAASGGDDRGDGGGGGTPQRERRLYRAILALALPSGAAYGLMALESGFVNFVLGLTRDATAALAAYSIYYRIMMFALMPLIAASVAVLPYTARHFGAGNLDAIRRGFRDITAAGFAYAIVLVAPACWFGGPALAHMLAEEPTTAAFSAFALRLVPLACIASIPFFICRPIFEGMQRGKPGLWMAVLRYLVFTIPFAFGGSAMAQGLGYPGFYGLVFGLVAATAVASAVFHLWLVRVLRHVPHPAGAA